MPFLDIRTIMLIGILMFLVICIFIFISSRKKNYRGIMLWNIGNILITTGIILFVLQGITEVRASILISNGLLLAGYTLLSAVLLLFLDIKPSVLFYFIVNILHCALMAFFIYITFDTGIRIFINSSAYMLVIAYTMAKIYGNMELRRNRTYRFILATYAVVFLNYLFKIFAAMVSGTVDSIMDANILMAIHFIILLVSYFIITMNLYDILVKRFENELIQKVHELEIKKDQVCVLHKELERKSTNLLIQQKELLAAVIGEMTDALIVYCKDKSVLLVNEAARNLLLCQPEDFKQLGDSLQSIKFFDMSGNELPTQKLPAFRSWEGEKVHNFPLTFQHLDKKFYVTISTSPVYGEGNEIEYVVACIHDITELVQKQSKINEQNQRIIQIEKEKNESLEGVMKLKDEFLYLITHEFKTPINVISSALQTLELVCKEELSQKTKRFLNTINQNTKRQLRLVNNLLDITRINSGHIKLNRDNYDIVYLTKAIVDSVRVYAQQKDIHIRFSSTLTKKEIYIDDEKYERILLNLLSNALKFTLSGKSVHVILKGIKYQNRNMVSITVQDEGIGIPKDKQEHIFEQFGQADTSLSRKAEGCGIGLYLVKMLVDALGGSITVESEEGKGCSFTVLLPAVKGESPGEYMSFIQADNRLIQAVAIEFSDIYF